MSKAILCLAALAILAFANDSAEPQRDPLRVPLGFTRPSNGSSDSDRRRQTTYDHNNLVLFGFGTSGGACWSGSCGAGYGSAPAAPAGYSQLRTGTSCINCGNYQCNQCTDWVSCAAHDAYWGWGCPSGYPYLGTSASENQWVGKPYTQFLFGYGSGCWSGSCGETAPAAPACPSGYDEVEYSVTCGRADDNYRMRCFGWDTCAFRRANNWGCSTSYPYYPFSVRECVASQILGIKYIQNAGSGLYMTMDQYGNFIATSTPFAWKVSYAPGSTSTYTIEIANPNTNIYPSSPWYWTAEDDSGFRVALTGGPNTATWSQWTIIPNADRQFRLQNVWLTSSYSYYHYAYYYDTIDLFFTYDGGSSQGNNALWNFIPAA